MTFYLVYNEIISFFPPLSFWQPFPLSPSTIPLQEQTWILLAFDILVKIQFVFLPLKKSSQHFR